MKKIFNILRLFLNIKKISKDPNDTEAALSVADNLYSLGLLDPEVQFIKSNSKNVEHINSQYMIAEIKLDELQKLPEGTLGKAYSDHMLKHNLQPDFYKVLPIVNDTTYVMMWMRQTHDFWHTITGFKTTIPHELGLQSFMHAQVRTPLASMLIGGRIIAATFKNFSEVAEIFDAVAHGWIMGKNADSIFSIPWDKKYAMPLADLRKEYRINPL